LAGVPNRVKAARVQADSRKASSAGSRRQAGPEAAQAVTASVERESEMDTGRLEILNGGFEGMTYDLTTEEIVIGRNPTTDITLLDEGISREHAMVLFDEDVPGFIIEDLASTNGTKVNGKRIRSAPLAEGDEIQIGQTLFRFVLIKD
jgi:Fe-S cluster assembly iron-binding protein IscA